MNPLITAIKRENKLTYILSTKCGFNPVVSHVSDCHESIEDIFNITPEMILRKEESPDFFISEEELNSRNIRNAKEVSRML